VAELRSEVTQAQATVVMVKTRATHAEMMAQERVILLATACGEADEAAQRVFALEGELVALS
jgi:hypothetical protein